MLNVIVLVAMAVTAAAFGTGLVLQAGLPLLPVLIGAIALFLVMAATYFRPGSGGGASGGDDRLADLEQALEVIDLDLQRLDRVEDGMSRLGALHETVDRLGQQVAGGAMPAGGGGVTPNDLRDVYARIETVRAEVETESRAQRQKIKDDLGVLEGLMTRMAGQGMVSSAPASPAPVMAAEPEAAPMSLYEEPISEEEPKTLFEPEPVLEPEPELEPEPLVEAEVLMEPEPETPAEPEPEPEVVIEEDVEIVEEVDLVEEELLEEERLPEPSDKETLDIAESVVVEESEPGRDEATLAAALAAVQPEAAPEPEPEPAAEDAYDDYGYGLLDDDDDEEMLEIVREGIEQGRVDLYLQPTVALPGRKVRYFEGLTRIRKSSGEIVMPEDYMPVAKRSALMPLIDNVLVVRAVQVLKRLGPDAPIEGVFANISMHSLLDPDYFPELIEFMEENVGLKDSLVFEISQAELQGVNDTEMGCLDALSALGFSFCLDNVSDIETGLDGLSERNFRFAKVNADLFLGGPGRNAADLKRRLDSADIELIIEKVENDGDITRLLDQGIELAQGHLFAKAKPMNAALSQELSNAGVP